MSDTEAPVVVSDGFSPEDEATGVPRGANLVITFSEPVRKGTGSNLGVRIVTADLTKFVVIPVTSNQISIGSGTNNNRVTINPAADLDASTAYYVNIPSGAFEDLSGNDYTGIATSGVWNFTTGTATADTTAPTVLTYGYSPADDAAAVPRNANLVLTFSEPVQKGTTGNIEIIKTAAPTDKVTIGR